jgi:hypothetical protein
MLSALSSLNNSSDISRCCFLRDIIVLCSLTQREDIVHRTLSPESVLLNEQGNFVLSDFALYYLTDEGRSVDFVIGFELNALACADCVLFVLQKRRVHGARDDHAWTQNVKLTKGNPLSIQRLR